MGEAVRVLLVESVSELGGAQWSLFELAGQLVKDGVDVLVAVPKGPLATNLKNAAIPVAEIPSYRGRRHPWYHLRNLIPRARATKSVAKIARRFKPDVIHANSIASGRIVAPLADTYPFVFHVRDLRFPARPMVRTARQAHRIVANSAAVDTFLSEVLHGSPRSKLVRVVNGIDLSRFADHNSKQARQTCGLPPTAPIVTMIAHLVPWKRHDLFLKMAQRILQSRPDVHFVIVGRDLLHEHATYRNTLRKLTTSLDLFNVVHWLEETHDVRDVLQATTVLVHPTPDEPFGRVLCEAMAMKTPTVALRYHGPTAIVDNNKTGILVDNPNELAAATLRLLNNPAEAERLGAAGRERVASLFNIERTASQMRDVYQAALNDANLSASVLSAP